MTEETADHRNTELYNDTDSKAVFNVDWPCVADAQLNTVLMLMSIRSVHPSFVQEKLLS